MTRKLYALRDDKVGIFNPPTVIQNDAAACRMLGDMVTHDKESVVHNHPEDFSLWSIGSFDDESGILSQDKTTLRVVCHASDFVKEIPHE